MLSHCAVLCVSATVMTCIGWHLTPFPAVACTARCPDTATYDPRVQGTASWVCLDEAVSANGTADTRDCTYEAVYIGPDAPYHTLSNHTWSCPHTPDLYPYSYLLVCVRDTPPLPAACSVHFVLNHAPYMQEYVPVRHPTAWSIGCTSSQPDIVSLEAAMRGGSVTWPLTDAVDQTAAAPAGSAAFLQAWRRVYMPVTRINISAPAVPGIMGAPVYATIRCTARLLSDPSTSGGTGGTGGTEGTVVLAETSTTLHVRRMDTVVPYFTDVMTTQAVPLNDSQIEAIREQAEAAAAANGTDPGTLLPPPTLRRRFVSSVQRVRVAEGVDTSFGNSSLFSAVTSGRVPMRVISAATQLTLQQLAAAQGELATPFVLTPRMVDVWVANVPANVTGTAPDGSWVDIESPAYSQVCPNRTACGGRNAYKPIRVALKHQYLSPFATSLANQPLSQPPSLVDLRSYIQPACRGRVSRRVQSFPAQVVAAVPSQRELLEGGVGGPLTMRGGALQCPPYCPGTTDFSNAPRAGVYYTRECVGYLNGSVCFDVATAHLWYVVP